MTIEQLRDKMRELREAANAVIAGVEAGGQDMTEAELSEVNQHTAKFTQLKAELEARETFNAQSDYLNTSEGRKTDPAQVETRNETVDAPVRVTGGTYRNDDKAKWGWRNIGEQAMAIRNASMPGGYVDKRLETRAPGATTTSQEGVGADGGFAVAPDFAAAINIKIQGEDSLLSRTDQMNTSSNSFTFPSDETTPWQTSGGIQTYWGAEGAQKTQSKVQLKRDMVELNKLFCLVPVTDELLDDASGMASYLSVKAPQKIDFAVNLAIVQGSGAGQPLGILNAPATVSVAKETSQDADSVVANNVIKMWARMYGPSRRNAVWLINQDIEYWLHTMSVRGKDDTGTGVDTFGGLVYMPANGLSDTPFSTLMGRPVIPTQACETLGDKGDIVLADLTQYLSITKTGGVRQDTSIHLWFDYDTTAFRFVLRLGGRPWWGAAASPRDGSNTLSPFVTLAERGA